MRKYLYPLIVFSYALASVLLFLYSYTQVDLNLTLSRYSIWQVIQKAFQYIGYYQRPLSTMIYIFILLIFYLLYTAVLWYIKKYSVTVKQLWKLILMVTALLVFAYPAFSYDMFNYMFTAKTVLVYHKNPYGVIPLQFTGVDPWLYFMHWTHLPSAYTPLWILFTLPAYILGFGYFLLILWNIKFLAAGFFILTILGIERILDKIEPKDKVLGMAIFALNPLVVIETLVSGHNDIMMMAMAMWGVWMFANKRYWASGLVLSLSVAAKLMTIFILPVLFMAKNLGEGWRKFMLFMMVVGFCLVLTQREVLPWYWVWIMPFVALEPQMGETIFLSGVVSLSLLLRYVPFLYFGDWNPPTPAIELWVSILPVLGAFLLVFLRRLLTRVAGPLSV